MTVEWQTVKELKGGEFRIRETRGKCILERRIEVPEDVTSECTVDLYEGACCSPNKYIRFLHNSRTIALVPINSIEMRDPRYHLAGGGNYSFRIVKDR